MGIIGISGKKQHGKNTVAKIWQLLDLYYNSNPTKNNDVKLYSEEEFVLKYFNECVSNFNWQQKSYAYKLKQIVCLLTGCSMEQLEDNEFKSSQLPENWELTRYRVRDKDDNFFTDWTFSQEYSVIDLDFYKGLGYDEAYIKHDKFIPTYRWMLQNVGTDAMRNYIHPDIWVNALFADYKEVYDHEKSKDLDEFEYVTNLPNWLVTDVRFPNEVDAIKERDGKLIRINRYQINDLVYWTDPDKGHSSGEYRVFYFEEDSVWLSNRVSEAQVPYHEIKLIATDAHPSECALDNYDDWDYVIHATSGVEDLIPKVKEIMIKEGIINE